MDGEITHFMTFDALEQKQRYRDDEISLLLFLGRELMKAQKMERLDDALHDFKNPAIATAGFARRLKELIKKGDLEGSKEQIDWYSDIIRGGNQSSAGTGHEPLSCGRETGRKFHGGFKETFRH